MASERILATYWVETPGPVERAAEVLAGEQSTGTFLRVPGETAELRDRYGARIERITPLATVDQASLPGARTTGGGLPRFQQAELVVSFALETVGLNLTTLLATVTGNLFELREFSGLRLLNLELPTPFATAYSGPQFGIDGTRKLTSVSARPLIGTIIKPSVGLSPRQTAELVASLADAGIDFVKDDELMADPPHSPFEKRVEAVMREVNANADRTGKKVMIAFNLSDNIDAMKRKHDFVLRHGGTCVMVSINHVGLTGVLALRQHSALPIHAHRNGWGMLTRCPALGIDFAPYQLIWRLAGVDHLHVNGLQNKFWEPDDSVVRSIQACRTPFENIQAVMPVISSGQWGGQAPETYRRCSTVDLMYLAGGGIMGHPGGPAAGVRSLRQAWEAAVAGIDIHTYARDHRELQQSLEKFGSRRA